jgi:two-component sensor histidine kinase
MPEPCGWTRRCAVTPELVHAERRSILVTLQALPSADHDAAPDIGLAFERIRGTWAGICDIEISVTPEVMANIVADAACSSAVADIVTESCANAVRHGHATHITVSITQPGSVRLVHVDIDNDGLPLDPASPTGLGASLIGDVALEWHLDTRPDGTRMSAILPTAIGPTRGSGRQPRT